MKTQKIKLLGCRSCGHIFEHKDIVYKPPLSNFAVIGLFPDSRGYESCPKCGDIAFVGWKKISSLQ